MPRFHRILVLLLASCLVTGCAEHAKSGHEAGHAPKKKAELELEELEVGSGPKPKDGDTVLVHYTGRLTDGTVFDSSYRRDEPMEVTIGEGKVIKGWEEGLVEMQVGGKYKLTVPPNMGYGDEKKDKIPPNSTLIFEMEIFKIKPKSKHAKKKGLF